MPRLAKGEPRYKTKRDDILRDQEIDNMIEQAGYTYGKDIQCLIALLWLFGKRVSEIIRLQRKDIKVKGGYLFVRFTVLKKKKIGLRRDRELKPWLETIRKQYLKNITLKNPYTKFVLQYIEDITDPEAQLFPGMYRVKAWRYIKKLNPKAWLHLFRESLATTWAEEGATEEDLMHWFDWDRFDTAHDYVKRGTRLIQRMAKRTW